METEDSLPYSQEPPLVRILKKMTPFYPISLRSLLILSSYLRLALTSGLFPSGFPTKILYAFLNSPTRTTCPAHSILHELIILIIYGETCEAPHYAVLSVLPPTLLGPDILFSILFPFTLSLCSSLTVRNQVSHPYKRAGKMIM